MDILTQKKVLTRLVAVLILLNVALIGFFGWKHLNKESRHSGNRTQKDLAAVLRQELGLRPEQAARFRQVREDFFRKERILRSSIRAKRDSMNQLMFRMNTPEDTIKHLAAAVAEHEYQMELLRIEQAAQLRAICEPYQLEKMETLIREIRDYLKPRERDLPQ